MSGVEELREVLRLIAKVDETFAGLDDEAAIPQLREAYKEAAWDAIAWLRTHAPALLERIAALEGLVTEWRERAAQQWNRADDASESGRDGDYERLAAHAVEAKRCADELDAALDAARVGGG